MTGSSASANTQPIQVNTLSSQITHHGNMTIVNSPKGVTMAWEAPANMDVAETAHYMGVSNLRHEVHTDMATGESTSVAYTELTHEEYEAYRNSRQGRSLELPPQPPEKMGNTIGTITFTPAPSGKRAEYANPPEKEPQESSDKPNEQLQALIDQKNDDRSLWQRTKDGAASAWDSTKRIANASWENPGEFGKGLAKGIGNLPSDIANLAVEGIKNGGLSPLNLNNYANLLDYQAMNAYEAGNIASANAMASRANSIREFGQVGDIFELTNDAQKGGSFASVFIPLGTLVKAPATAAKGMRTAKTVEAITDTTKAADTVSDVAKVPEPKGPVGNGGKIIADKKLKKKNLPCFKKNKKGDPKEYDRQLKGQQDGLNNMTAKEYLDGRAAYTGNRASTAAERKKYETKLSKSYFDSGAAKTKSEAQKMASDKMKTLNALHNPDMIAAGKDIITDFGDAGVNKSIGSQWNKAPKGETMSRVEMLDKEAKEAVENGNGDHNMNANMHRCP